ncbi:uncharacterized protein LOC123322322 [Coccinella septempunctata]|uniref:uncharacterized protein LOC123322322 n=1 Tax=Coccinella septempunctata TaxID=41139 RepID=UPI001D06C833|nr:uncharacterized protein LOC123322322 [Coccinella septempunctata]
MDENQTDQIPGGLFIIIKERHGNIIYGRCKDFVNGHRKLARLTNRRIFLLRCRRERIFPNHIIHNINQIYSLEVEEHPFRNKIGKILSRFRNSILNVEIKITIWNLRKTNQRLRESDAFLANLISPSLVSSLRSFARKTLDRVLLETKENNVKKLDNLLRTQKPTVNLVTSDNYIRNYTGVVLPDNVKSVLALGPKHGIPPFKFPTLEVIKDIESCISVSPFTDEIKNKYRIRCINTINNYRNNPVSGRLQQTPTFKQLTDTNNFVRDHPELIINSSDKGNTTVVMYRGEYLEEAHRMLSDTEVYVLLTADPTKLYQDKINRILKKFKEESMITADEYKKLIRHNGISPRLYFLRKTHKEGLSFRPISNNINSPTYNIGKFLHQILSQVLSTSPYNVKNSFDLKRDLQGVHVPEGYILVSLDVVSLFTYISRELVITMIKKQWNYIKNFTNLSR